MVRGYFTFVLHSHIPWVLGHGRWPHGTDWLNEATAECYIPILEQLYQLVNKGCNPQLTIGLTPILQEQLQSRHFAKEFEYYLTHKIEAARKDMREFSRTGDKDFMQVAQMWFAHYTRMKLLFHKKFQKKLVTAFKNLQDKNRVEIITSAATHGYLPLLKHDRSVSAQIELGVRVYEKNFRQPPRGIWLPECAYRPPYRWKAPVGHDHTAVHRKGIDEFLSKNHLAYFIIDAHLLRGGKAIGVYLARFKALKNLWQQYRKESVRIKRNYRKQPQEVYLVASNPSVQPVALLTRDPKTALQVWSGEVGYPGDAYYLDFHKKRFPSGLRYWRVTNPKIDLALKKVYEPTHVEQKIKEHARHFVSIVKEIARAYYEKHKTCAYICTPFDTELFGHWWFEGPRWLSYVLQYIEKEKDIALATGSTMVERAEPDRIITLPEGSWGEGGYHYIWLNKWTEWTWRRVYEAEDTFYTLYDQYRHSRSNTKIAALQQLSRELLLLQASDWQFLISTWSARDYAEHRFSKHYENFKKLASIIKKRRIAWKDRLFLADLEEQDSCFSDVPLSLFK